MNYGDEPAMLNSKKNEVCKGSVTSLTVLPGGVGTGSLCNKRGGQLCSRSSISVILGTEESWIGMDTADTQGICKVFLKQRSHFNIMNSRTLVI